MRGYITYFKLQIINTLQYKTAAIAGVLTQFFWGFIFIFVFQAFYSSSTLSQPINFNQLVQYIWLGQAFFTITYIAIDKEIVESIKSGNVCYELTRPYNLYFFWYIKVLAKKYAAALLRFSPIIMVTVFLPEPYQLNLPVSNLSFIFFLISLMLGSFIISGIVMLINIFTFYNNSEDGITNIVIVIAQLLSGGVLPIPFLPDIIQQVGYLLPFRLIGDLSFRVYSGNILVEEAFYNIVLQIFWVIALIFIGNLLIKKASKKIYVQGG